MRTAVYVPQSVARHDMRVADLGGLAGANVAPANLALPARPCGRQDPDKSPATAPMKPAP
jgi:hypothetical protein